MGAFSCAFPSQVMTRAESELNRLRDAAASFEPPAFKLSKGYIREKLIGGRAYYYIVTSERVNGRVRQKMLAYLGTDSNPQTALNYLSKRLDGARRSASSHRLDAESINQKVSTFSQLERLCADLPAFEKSRQRHLEQAAKAESKARIYESRINRPVA